MKLTYGRSASLIATCLPAGRSASNGMKAYKPVMLVILDGFGVSLEEKGNPVLSARTPTLDLFDTSYPFTTLQASGVAVGLPWGEAGNSEVGHLTMGAGRVIYHHLPRIISAIHDGSFFQNEALLAAAGHVKKNASRLHIFGLVSSGSVHSYIDHLYALLKFVEEAGVPEAYLHVVTDGKDAPPKEAVKFLPQIEERVKKEFPHTRIASVVGRFYAMDRDEKWERIEAAYELYTEGKGNSVSSVTGYLESAYEAGLTDEFIEPGFVPGPTGAALALIREGDAAICFNFREDSVREISHALTDVSFDFFPRRTRLQNFQLVTMTEYERNLEALAAFPPLEVREPLARVLSDAGLRQLHIAETEKYAHVTYFFNGGREKPYAGEERILVPSVPTAHFDDVPEMKAGEITARVLEELPRNDFILVNFANTDMVGHTGKMEAASRAVEALDRSLGELAEAVLALDGILIVTGDHGNVEAKQNPLTGEAISEHSINPVPLYLVGRDFRLQKLREHQDILKAKREVGGILTDIAPTVLQLMGLRKSAEMTGSSLVPELTRQHFHQN